MELIFTALLSITLLTAALFGLPRLKKALMRYALTL